MAAAVDLRLQAVAEVIWPVAGVVAIWAVAGAVTIWRGAAAGGGGRGAGKGLPTLGTFFIAPPSPLSMSTATLTPASFVTASFFPAGRGGRATLTTRIN